MRFVLMTIAIAIVVGGFLDSAGLLPFTAPRSIEHSELWNDNPPEGYCRIGPHVANYSRGFYENQRRGAHTTVFYPIYPVKSDEESAASGSKREVLPTPNHIILVQTRRFPLKEDMFNSKSFSEGLNGRVIGGRYNMPLNGLELVNKEFGGRKKVIIFKEGRAWGLWPVWPFTLVLGLAIALGAMNIPVESYKPMEADVLDWSDLE